MGKNASGMYVIDEVIRLSAITWQHVRSYPAAEEGREMLSLSEKQRNSL